MTFNGGTLQVSTTGLTFGQSVVLNTNGGTIDTLGANTVKLTGTITGSGGLTVTDSTNTGGTVVLNPASANSYAGNTAVNIGSLQLGNSNALPIGATVVLGSGTNSGTLDLNNFNATVTSLTTSGTGTGNTVTNSGTAGSSTSTLTFAGGTSSNAGNPDVFGGTLKDSGASGPLALTVNSGVLALIGANTYTGATTVNGGTLALAFQTTTQTNIAPSGSNLVLGGGVLALQGFAAGTNNQTFSGTTLNAGASQVQILVNGATSVMLNLDNGTAGLTRNAGSTVDFVIPTGGTITTSASNGATTILGGYATVNGSTWAVSPGTAQGAITGLTTYSTTFATGTNVDVQGGPTTLNAGTVTVNSVRFNNTGAAYQVTIGNGNSLSVTSGGILETAAVGNFGVAIGVPATTATLTSGNSQDLIVIQNNQASSMTINAQITGSIALTKSGAGTLVLTNTSNNSTGWTGVTYINQGTLSVAAATMLARAR